MRNKGLYISLGIIVLVVAAFLLFGFSKPDESIEKATLQESADPINSFSINENKILLDPSSYTFNFEGYAIGKSLGGTFTDMEANYIKSGDTLEYIELKINVDSIDTGLEGLDQHLKAEDFFESETYPEIIFISKEINDDSIIGDLTIRRITKEITIPTTKDDSIISSDFLVNIRDFGVTNKGVNDDIRLDFSFNY